MVTEYCPMRASVTSLSPYPYSRLQLSYITLHERTTANSTLTGHRSFRSESEKLLLRKLPEFILVHT